MLILEASGHKILIGAIPKIRGCPVWKGGSVGLPRGVGEQAPYTRNGVRPNSVGAFGRATISGHIEIGYSDPVARWRSLSQ
jgi:hypothetical protein